MKNHKDLEVWKKSIDFAVNIYKLIESFPHDEKYALVSQMKRAAVSIASNISEGAARNSSKEFIQFLYISLGSAAEIETQLVVAEKLNYISRDHSIIGDLEAIQRMIMGLIKYIKNRNP